MAQDNTTPTTPTPKQGETSLQQFIVLLYTATDASRATDAFDLNSQDPSSVAVWRGLTEEEITALQTLVHYTRDHADAILGGIFALSAKLI